MRRLLALLVAACSLLVARDASACDCVPPHTATELLAPADGANDVPPNAKIWIGAGFTTVEDASLTLLDKAGKPVAGHTQALTSGWDLITVFAPDAPLVEGQTYSVKVGGKQVSRFAVKGGTDLTAPAIPTAGTIEVEIDEGRSDCGATYMGRVNFLSDGLVMVLDREGESTLDPLGPSGNVSAISFRSERRAGDRISVGRGPCVNNWPAAKPGAKTQVRLGAFDLAGNFSGFGPPVSVVLRAPCGCSSGGGALGGYGVIVLMALGRITARRRRS